MGWKISGVDLIRQIDWVIHNCEEDLRKFQDLMPEAQAKLQRLKAIDEEEIHGNPVEVIEGKIQNVEQAITQLTWLKGSIKADETHDLATKDLSALAMLPRWEQEGGPTLQMMMPGRMMLG